MSDRGKVKILSDVVPEAGLGGSASCFVAGLKAIYPQLDNSQLAKLAFYLERKVMNNAGGMQDQICASYGGLLFMTLEGEHIGIEKVEIEESFSKYLILIFVGNRVVPGNDVIQDQLRCYNVKALHRNKQLARLMKECLVQKNYIEFGKLLNEAWQCKKDQSCLVSNDNIDMLYKKLLGLGAIGGVLTGAGAGGYMLVMEHPDKEGELRQNLVQQNIAYHNVEFDTLGARIVET
jgi:D-glycero-alpha-D-manno-heptose-7-phosphate kinase